MTDRVIPKARFPEFALYVLDEYIDFSEKYKKLLMQIRKRQILLDEVLNWLALAEIILHHANLTMPNKIDFSLVMGLQKKVITNKVITEDEIRNVFRLVTTAIEASKVVEIAKRIVDAEKRVETGEEWKYGAHPWGRRVP